MNLDTTIRPEPITSTAATTAGPPARGWAAAGVAAAVLSATGIAASMAVDAAYAPGVQGDASAIADRLAELPFPIVFSHVTTVAGALLLVIFGAGLTRHLRARVPADSLLPGVAAAGLGLVAVVGVLGTAFTTEALFGVMDPEAQLVPEVAAVFAHWIGTVGWLWVGAGLSALALGQAALRHGAAARWLGFVSLGLGALTTLVGISPLQYMAGMIGPLWLLIATVALWRDTRAGGTEVA